MSTALVIGIVQGGIYGLLALGLVLVYKGSRVLNFAQAEIGTVSLFLAYWIVTVHHLPWIVGAVCALLLGASIALVFERLIVRPMGAAPRLSVAVATIGLLTLLLSLELLQFGPSPRVLAPPIEGLGVQIADVFVSPTRLIALGAVAVIGLGLAAFLRFTDFGLGVLAAAEDATAVRLVGVRLSHVSAFTWGLSGALSALAALLIAPTLGVFTPGVIGAPLFVAALAGALLGGMTSLPGAFVGGIGIGVIEAVTKYVVISRDLSSSVPGAESIAIFAVILVVLLVRPRGILGRAGAPA
jgi:branched-chain amino acid transport system permease protein